MSRNTKQVVRVRALADSAGKRGARGVHGNASAAPPDDQQTPAQRVISSVAAMREVLAHNPQATIADIDAALRKRGIDKPLATIGTIRSDFLGVYRALAKAGALKCPVDL